MNEEKLFDFICAKHDWNSDPKADGDFKYNGKIFTPKQSHEVIKRSIQGFIHKDVSIIDPANKKHRIQAFYGSSSLPKLTKDVFNVTMQVNEFDLLWQNAFKSIPLKRGQLEWEIADVASAIAFKLIPEGSKVEFEGITGSKVIVGIEKYGAALAVTWETIEGRKLYKFVEQLNAMRSALFTLWANTHYGLLAAAGLLNQISYQLTGTDRQIDRDIATLNEGGYQLGLINKDKGYGNTASARYLFYGDPRLDARVLAALKATNADVTRNGQQGVVVTKNIQPYFTFNNNIPANKGLLVLPGQKIQNSIYLREMGLSKKEIESLNELRTYWTAYGAIIADTDQVFELSFT